ncbi:MAG TPA: type II secretion system F family protein [Acidimicrobiales bacterium]|nr:type II secretion system F family protein [Acidimicrobiales bacterium]
MTALSLGALVAACGVATVASARRAHAVRRSAVVIGRVTGVAPPDARPVRSIPLTLRDAPPQLAHELRALHISLDALRVWHAWLISLVVALGVGAWLAGPVLGLLSAAALGVAPLGIRAVLRSRSEAAYDASLVCALDAVSRSVRSGGSLAQALAEAPTSVRGAVAAELAAVATAIARGRPFADALADWRSARPRPSVRLAVGALVLAADTGGPPARVIEDVASAIRARQQVAREAHALAAQARLSALVVGLAPLGFMALMCVTDPRNTQVLFGTGVGIACVVTGLALDALGALWMHRLSARVAA